MNFANFAKKTAPPPGAAQSIGSATQVADDSFDVSNNKGYSLALFICWMAAFVAIAGSVFFWLLNGSAKQAIKEKSQEKSQIISEIAAPSLADIEVKASTFKAAVAGLSSVSTDRYSTSEFLPKFYEKIAQNIQVGNFSMSTDGKISFDGKAPSYRAVADQLLLLKEWKVNNVNILKNVELMNVNQMVNEQTKKLEVSYAITASVDKVQSLTEKPKATVSEQAVPTGDSISAVETSIDISNEITGGGMGNTVNQGGENATVQ